MELFLALLMSISVTLSIILAVKWTQLRYYTNLYKSEKSYSKSLRESIAELTSQVDSLKSNQRSNLYAYNNFRVGSRFTLIQDPLDELSLREEVVGKLCEIFSINEDGSHTIKCLDNNTLYEAAYYNVRCYKWDLNPSGLKYVFM
jgi:hypothetical protein